MYLLLLLLGPCPLLLLLATPCQPLLLLPSSPSPYSCDDLLGDQLCPLEVRKDTVQVRGSSVHYWVYQPVGFLQSSSALLPVITINGGPGFPHNYLLPLKHLACQGRQVVFYDQVGTGESSICPAVDPGENPNDCGVDPAHDYLLTKEYYPEEVEAIVQSLGLQFTGYHVFGHSWGTIVGVLYAASSPPGLVSLVLGGALANTQVYINAQWDPEEGNLGTLPRAMQDNIRRLEALGNFTSSEYLAIADLLTAQFTVRTFPPPDCVSYCNGVVNYQVYVEMQGPSEFSVSPDCVLADMDLSPQLRNISIPVLLTNGGYDTMRGPNIRQMAGELSDVTLAMLDNSGHMTMVDQPLEMSSELTAFWNLVEEKQLL